MEYFDSLERIFFFFFSVLKRRADSLQPVRPPDLHIHNVLALFFFSNFWRICIQMTKKKGEEEEEEEEESRPPKTRFSFDFVWCETSHSNTSSPSGVVIARFNHTPHPTTSFSSTPPPPTKPHNQPPAVLHFFSFLLLLLLSNTWFFTHVQLVFFSCFFSRSNRIIERKKKVFLPRGQNLNSCFFYGQLSRSLTARRPPKLLCVVALKKSFDFIIFARCASLNGARLELLFVGERWRGHVKVFIHAERATCSLRVSLFTLKENDTLLVVLLCCCCCWRREADRQKERRAHST